jgi:hypothetical protein
VGKRHSNIYLSVILKVKGVKGFYPSETLAALTVALII